MKPLMKIETGKESKEDINIVDAVRNGEDYLDIHINDKPPSDIEKFDICLVVRISDENYEISDKEFSMIENLISSFGRKNVYVYESAYDRLRFILIRASVSRMKTKAERLSFPMLLDPVACRVLAANGDPQNNIDPFVIPYSPEVTSLRPFDLIYAPYRCDADIQNLYWKPSGSNHPFRHAIRLKLVTSMIQDPFRDGGAGINLSLLLQQNVIQACFPLHNWREINSFSSSWIGIFCNPLSLPLSSIREYFGEKISIFFGLIEHLSFWLLFPIAVGLAFQILSIYYVSSSLKETPVFAFLLAMWSVTVLFLWKRRLAYLSLQWGLTSSTPSSSQIWQVERNRPHYYGKEIRSSVNGNPDIFFPPSEFRSHVVLTSIILVFFIVVALAQSIAIYVIKAQISVSSIDKSRQWIISAITVLWIAVLNSFYYRVAILCTNFENHRTVREYNQFLVLKVFILQFFNTFSTFYFIAFAAPYISSIPSDMSYVSRCGLQSCMEVLTANLSLIYGGLLMSKNFFSFVLPLLSQSLASFFLCMTDQERKSSPIVDDKGNDSSSSSCCGGLFSRSTTAQKIPSSMPPLPKKGNTRGKNHDDMDSEEGEEEKEIESQLDAIEMWDIYQPKEDGLEGVNRHGQVIERQKDDPNAMDLSSFDYPDTAEKGMGQSRVNTAASWSVNRAVRSSFMTISPEMDYYLQSWEQAPRTLLGCVDCSLFGESDLVSFYSELLLTLGFILLFGSAMPGVTLVAWIDLYFMCQRHGWRFLYRWRRPWQDLLSRPLLATSQWKSLFGDEIDAFMQLFEVIIILSVVTNSGLIFFTMRDFRQVHLEERFWYFYLFQIFVLFYRYLLQHFVGETPSQVEIQLQRACFIHHKLIDKVPDFPADPSSIL